MSKATIHYHDIGDYLSQTDKLKLVHDFKSFLHLPATIIEPNEHGDWISVRNDVFGTFIPIISEEDKSYHATSKSYFVCVSGSVISSRDAWCFNFSELKLQENIQETILHYNEQRKLLNAGEIKEPIIDSQKGSWSQIWLDLVKKNFELIEEQEYRVSQYRPFTKTNTYFGKDLNARRYQLPKFFPNSNIDNLVICVTGKSMFSFSTLIRVC